MQPAFATDYIANNFQAHPTSSSPDEEKSSLLMGASGINIKIAPERRDYWVPKLKRNVQRDLENVRQLSELGWQVHIVWECSFSDFQAAVRDAIRFLKKGGQ